MRRTLHRAQLPYALGVASDVKVFLGTPVLQPPVAQPRTGRPRTRPQLPAGTQAIEARVWAAAQGPPQWRRVSWRNGTNPPWRARFCAIRVTPAHDWRERRLAPEVWLLCERDLGAEPRTKYYLVNLPPTASLQQLVQLAHQRWAIEQQYQELKDELGLDHFEGRSLPGWEKHVVLNRPGLRVAATRTRTPRRAPAHAAGRASGDHRDSHGPFLRHASALSGHHAETARIQLRI